MQIWTIANQKGGVGKTTTTVNLAGLLAASGKRVLLIDLDPHGSMTSYFGYDPDTIEDSVYSLFEKNISHSKAPLASMLCRTSVPKMDLLPACTALVSLDRRIASQEGMGLIIKKALENYQRHYHYVMIDCPPTLGILMVNALAACERLIIPVQTEFLAIKGLERMLNTLKMIIMSGKRSMDYLIVPTMYDQRTRASKDSIQYMKTHYPDQLWADMIPVDTHLRESSRLGQPINFLYPKSHAALAYVRLLEFLCGNASSEQAPAEEVA